MPAYEHGTDNDTQSPVSAAGVFDWLLDNDLTPHLVVNANIPHVMVPMQFVQDGQIVLNIAPGRGPVPHGQ